jgi:hypothetical protein
MGLQASMNQNAVDMLPKIKAAIEAADGFDANQMKCSIIRGCLNTSPSLVEKTLAQLEAFQDDFIEYFKRQGWLVEQPAADQFRFQNGSLYEYDSDQHDYVHCFKNAFCNTKKKAIGAYFEMTG